MDVNCGKYRYGNWLSKKRGLIDWTEAERVASEALARVECDFDPSTRVSDLSRTEKSLVAIARALAVDCDFLVLDEPTASLPADEVKRLFDALKPLKEKGVGMIFVSHRLDEVFVISDRVAVLRDGRMVGVRDVSHTTAEELVAMIVGRKTRSIVKPEIETLEPLLKISDFNTENVGPVNLEISRGELVGLVGLRGAGHEDIGRSLFGISEFVGRIELDAEVLELKNPQSAMQSGIGFVAGDRVVESIAPSLTVRENAFINPLARGREILSFVSASEEKSMTADLGDRVGLSPNDPTLAIEALSGGNQQKVVVGRWLDTDRKLLIAEDPTAGVDVGAKAEIYNLLFEALAKGLGVIVVSTDFEEIANICHRAFVFSRGTVVDELSGFRLSTETLIQAASVGRQKSNLEEINHAIH